MKIYIIATEASGDYLGSHLIRELKKKKNCSIQGIGGELMKMEGLSSWIPIEKFNTIGLVEVLIRIPKFYKIFKRVENLIKNNPPDMLITIDSPSSAATIFAFSFELSTNLTDIESSNSLAIFRPILLAPAIIILFELGVETPREDNSKFKFFDLTKKNTLSSGSNLKDPDGIVIFSSLTIATIKDLKSVFPL